jgi:hypothetical protein
MKESDCVGAKKSSETNCRSRVHAIIAEVSGKQQEGC